MADMIRLVTIKTAGPEGKHCDSKCRIEYRGNVAVCGHDELRLGEDHSTMYLRTPECLGDAKDERITRVCEHGRFTGCICGLCPADGAKEPELK
jgi:hypothetical protein